MSKRNWTPGQRFGRLVIKERVVGLKRQIWSCDCDCGAKGFRARADKLDDGRTTSCGCRKTEYVNELRRISLVKQEELAAKALEKSNAVAEQKYESESLKAAAKVEEKHRAVCLYLKVTGVPDTDPLWYPRYYAAVIADGCHYCHRPLSEPGASLCLVEPNAPIEVWTASAVVPICDSCNTRRFIQGSNRVDSLSHKEMELLGQTLELIRLERK